MSVHIEHQCDAEGCKRRWDDVDKCMHEACFDDAIVAAKEEGAEERDDEVDGLNDKIDEANGTIAELKNEITELKAQLEEAGTKSP